MIEEGIKQGFFGIGKVKEGGVTVCRHFNEDASISATDTEVLMNEVSCLAQRRPSSVVTERTSLGDGVRSSPVTSEETETIDGVMRELSLKLPVPRGKIAQIMGVMNFLQSMFQSLQIEIRAAEGSITESEYAEKIKEAMKQLGIDLERA